jgi:indolepyruvate ferredoxin oxidoreductase alpha subunit
MTKVLKEAGEYSKQEGSTVAVVIARHPCLVYGKHLLLEKKAGRVFIPEEECDGCGVCVTQFDCPAITQEARKMPARILEEFCTDCGTCLSVCPKKHIRREAS